MTVVHNYPQLHENIRNAGFWSNLEELHEKRGDGPQLHLLVGVEFLELGLYG